MSTLTDELKQMMERENITAVELATRLKLKPKTVQPWVATGKSHSEPSPQNQVKIRQLLRPESQPQQLPDLAPAVREPMTTLKDHHESIPLFRFDGEWQGKTIREPIQTDVELTTLETRIIDTPDFQRLRHIKELGTASLVFPGATHTRFEHSLGTLAVAQHMIDALNRNANPPIPKDVQLLIRLCALLHDITHIPYGHTLEDEGFLFKRHDEAKKQEKGPVGGNVPPWKHTRYERFLGESSAIGTILGKEQRELVMTYLTTKGDAVNQLDYPYVVDIVGNTVCADLLDYLARDTYYAGLHETYDPRFLRNLTIASYVAKNNKEKSYKDRVVLSLLKKNRMRRDVVSEVMNLLRLRYSLAEKVYFHHAKVITSAMIIEAVQAALIAGRTEFTEDGLASMLLGDDEMLVKLRDCGEPIAKKMIDRLCVRSLYKPVYMLTYNAESAEDTSWPKKRGIIEGFRQDPLKRFQTERRLESWLSLSKGSVIVYCPTEEMNLKVMEALCLWRDGKVMPLRDIPGEKLAADAKGIEESHKELWKLYVLLERGLSGERELMQHLASDCYREFALPNCMEEFSIVEAPPLERFIEQWALANPRLSIEVVEKRQLVELRSINKERSLEQPPNNDDLERDLKDIRVHAADEAPNRGNNATAV